MLACVIFNKTEFNRVSGQELFLMWCIHNKKQVCWTYWIFNQMLAYAPRKDAPLTHGHVITIIAKALNINLANYTHFAEHSYFTKQAFIRGEVVDASFPLVYDLVGEALGDLYRMRIPRRKNQKRVNPRKHNLNLPQ